MHLPHSVCISLIMMKRSPTEFYISAGAYFYASLLLLLLPLKLVASIFIAAAFHECCHILMLRCFHVPVLRIELGVGGARIQTAPLPPKQELLCAAAGPIGSFLCLLLIRFFPLLALCGLAQGLFNLLPVFPLDGGRMLRCFCLCFFPKYADAVCRAARWCTILSAFLLCMILTFRTQSGFYVLLAGYFLLQTGAGRKIPCKQRTF